MGASHDGTPVVFTLSNRKNCRHPAIAVEHLNSHAGCSICPPPPVHANFHRAAVISSDVPQRKYTIPLDAM
jgi:hypothetical protein